MLQSTFQIVNREDEYVKDIKLDPVYKELVPPLTKGGFKLLQESIIEVGLYEPIVINQDKILLDGHHRFKVIQELGWSKIPVERKYFENDVDEKIYVIETNVIRRQLSEYQRTLLGQELEPLYSEKAKQNQGRRTDLTSAQICANVDTDKEVSKKIGMGERTYQMAKYVLKNASPNKKQLFIENKKAASSIYRELKHLEKIEKLREEIPEIVEPDGLFDVIVVDPPWPYGNKYDADADRSPTR